MKTHFDPLEEKVDVEKLLKNIYFAEEDVYRANLTQAKLQYQVARYRVQRMRRRIRLEHELELLKYKFSILFRKKLGRGKPPTEATVKERVAVKPRVVDLQKQLDKAIIDDDLAKQLFEVFKQRQIAIRNIIEARRTETARSLYQLESQAKHKKLQAASKLLREKYKEEEDEDEE